LLSIMTVCGFAFGIYLYPLLLGKPKFRFGSLRLFLPYVLSS